MKRTSLKHLNTLARQQAAEFDTNHWAWVARTTTRMTTGVTP